MHVALSLSRARWIHTYNNTHIPTHQQGAFLMRHIVLPILAEREAVSFCISSSATTKTKQLPQQQQPHNALGWPVFDREGKLMAVVVAVDHYLVEGQGEEETDDDDEGRRDASSARKEVVVGKAGQRYAAFGAEEERMMVNLCSQVRTVLSMMKVDNDNAHYTPANLPPSIHRRARRWRTSTAGPRTTTPSSKMWRPPPRTPLSRCAPPSWEWACDGVWRGGEDCVGWFTSKRSTGKARTIQNKIKRII